MKSIRYFLFMAVSTLVFQTAFAETKSQVSKKDVPVQAALVSMAKFKHLGTYITVMKRHMSIEDREFLIKELQKSKGGFLKPLGAKVLGKNSLQLSGLKGPLVFNESGSEVTYLGKVFHMNNEKTFERNVENFRKQLAGRRANATNWILPTAHAEMFDEYQEEIRENGVHLAMAMQYVSSNVDFRSDNIDYAKLADDNTLEPILAQSAGSLVTKIKCEAVAGSEQWGKYARITVYHADGTSVELDNYRFNNKEGVLTFSNKSGTQDFQGTERNEQLQTMKSLAENYCPLSEADQAKAVKVLAEVQYRVRSNVGGSVAH